MTSLRLSVILLATIIVAAGCTTSKPSSHPTQITILHTNDHHGRFWRNRQGEYGMAARQTLIESIREQVASRGGITLLLSGGDINTGVPESDMLNAEPDFLGMNALGYDAMALGNHEFDNPTEVLQQQRQWAGFPFLSANTIIKESGEPLFPRYTIIQRGGLNIAIIGLTTTDTAQIGNPQYVGGLDFIPPLTVVPDLITHIKDTYSPDMTLALTHMGHFLNGEHGSNAAGDVALARGLEPEALNAIIGGHSQNPVCMASANTYRQNYQPDMPCQPDRQNGIWIMQAYEWGKYVGRADFAFQSGQWQLTNYQLLPVNLSGASKQYEEDQQLLSLLAPYQEKGQAMLGRIIGHSNARFSGHREVVRRRPAALGKLIGLAQMQATKADIAVISGGGIRASLPAGPISYKDVLKVHPFGNTVTYVDMTAHELRQYIQAVNRMTPNSGAYPQWYNLTFTDKADGSSELRIGGKPLSGDTTYRLALNSFNASGGDGYPPLIQHPNYVDTGWVDADILVNYISKNSPIAKPPG